MNPIALISFLFMISAFFISDKVFDSWSLSSGMFVLPFIVVSVFAISYEMKTKFLRTLILYNFLILFFFIYWGDYNLSNLSNLIGPTLLSICAFSFSYIKFYEKYLMKIFLIFILLFSVLFYFGFWDEKIYSSRYSFLDHNENYLSHLLLVGIIFTLYLNNEFRNSTKKYLIVFFVILIPLLSTGSRTGITAAIFVIICHLLYSKSYQLFSARNIFLSLFSFAALIYLGISDYLNVFTERFYQIGIDDRTGYWLDMIEIISQNPITGIGFEKFYSNEWRESVGLVYYFGTGKTYMSVHNSFLDIFLMGGILLFICFSVIVFFPIYHCYKKFSIGRFNNDHLLISLLIVSVISFGLSGQIISDKFSWFLIGYCYLLIYKEKYK